MTDDARLTPLTMAMYTARYPDVDLAGVVADHLAAAWRTRIAVASDFAGRFHLFDLTVDVAGTIEGRARYIAEPQATP